jgi:menaquinone-dependent protoporphyrinogen oxidase
MADRIYIRIPESDMFDMHDSELYNIEEYDTIVVGAPIYEGAIIKDAERFFKENKKILLKKRLGIFCSGMNSAEFNQAVQKSLPPDIFYDAELVHCGGRVIFKELSFWDKRTIKRRLGITEDEILENTEKMEEFIKWIKK